MQLGFVSAILPDLSLEEVFAVARETGHDCVEVCCWPPSRAERRYAGVTHIDCTSFGPADVDHVQTLIRDSGVQISGLGYYPNPLTPDANEAETAVQHLHLVIDAAKALGVGVVNTFIGRDWTRSVDENWPRFLATWRPIVAHASRQGIRIGIENCPMLFTADEWPGGKNLAVCPAIWRRMFEAIPDAHFGLNYDPSHMVWQQMDYLAPLREFADRLMHIHAKDVRLDRHKLDAVGILAHPNAYHTPKLPGLGEIDWGKFISVLGDVGYRGPVCVEVEDRSYEGPLESRKGALRQSATYLRNFIPAAIVAVRSADSDSVDRWMRSFAATAVGSAARRAPGTG
ncbi:MAG: sugar phosphate isomerase/epimerase family protein [Planctomycetaceae bacterium]